MVQQLQGGGDVDLPNTHWLEICDGTTFAGIAGIAGGGVGRIVLVKETVTVGVIVVTIVDAM